MKKWLLVILSASLLCTACTKDKAAKIDRLALVERNNPHVTSFDSLTALSVGNGNFAFTVDATGLQTYPESYAKGIPLGTQTQWGWHSFPNPNNYKLEETFKEYDFGRGHKELYAVQFNEKGRQHDAADWYRINPHRLHLGNIGFELTNEDGTLVQSKDIESIDQHLDLWNGIIESTFKVNGEIVEVKTAAHPSSDRLAVSVASPLISKGALKINLRFSYPTGGHADDACDRTVPNKHKTEVVSQDDNNYVLKRTLDADTYFVTLKTDGKSTLSEKEAHYLLLTPESDEFSFVCEFTDSAAAQIADNNAGLTFDESSKYWQDFWQRGGAIDFSNATDSRAKELERRIILSQYLMAIQSAGMYPPQETGLTYNSWFGKFHLEMHWWHAVHFALWNRIDLLERSMDWYATAYPIAKSIAERQGFDGLRWMKMTDPSATEAPSKVGSFLIWQQPHFIYMAELIYRANPSPEVIEKYGFLVEETAKFMASFATYDELEGRYLLKGIIAAQETLRASETINPPFEVSYWHYAMGVAQKWRERADTSRNMEWDELIDKLSPLASKDGLYLASEDALDTYIDIRFTSDHPAVLGAVGMLPQNKLLRPDYMKNTLDWILENWNWGKTWGWDYPMTAMCAARLNEPAKAVDALMMNKRTNTYLLNGHNYQDARLRVYLPGNGGLLIAAAMMCAGWDGNEIDTPGFPKDGTWNVQWEDLVPMP
mgnify:FL=1